MTAKWRAAQFDGVYMLNVFTVKIFIANAVYYMIV